MPIIFDFVKGEVIQVTPKDPESIRRWQALIAAQAKRSW